MCALPPGRQSICLIFIFPKNLVMNNNFKRRDFLKLGTGLLGGVALGAMACNNSSDSANAGDSSTAKDSSGSTAAEATALTAFGIQLYSLRDDFPKDPKGVLKQVADMGYKQVEGFERD